MACNCNKAPFYGREQAIRMGQNLANLIKSEVIIYIYKEGFRFAKKGTIQGAKVIEVARPL